MRKCMRVVRLFIFLLYCVCHARSRRCGCRRKRRNFCCHKSEKLLKLLAVKLGQGRTCCQLVRNFEQASPILGRARHVLLVQHLLNTYKTSGKLFNQKLLNGETEFTFSL